jgi:hypothetical protein
MAQSQSTILRVSKRTRNKLRELAIAKKETYDEIINRLLGSEGEDEENLENIKKNLIKKGISKDLVNLVGILPKTDARQDKRLIGEAVRRWAANKTAV